MSNLETVVYVVLHGSVMSCTGYVYLDVKMSNCMLIAISRQTLKLYKMSTYIK